VDAMICDHVVPPSRLTSRRTVAELPRLFVHVMAWTDPTVHVTLVFGEVTCMVGVASVKLLELSVTLVLAVQTARIRAFVTGDPATVQLKLPPVPLVFWTEGAIVVQVMPPF
jgi:hypothetical protein